jgi:IS605 OrfB family transposase
MDELVSRAIKRHSAVGLTAKKHGELRELALRSTRARSEFVNDHWDPRHVLLLLRRPRELIEARRRAGTLRRAGLTTHQTEAAYKDAIWALRVSWGRAVAQARFKIYRNPLLNDQAKHWMFFVLRWPEHLQACLDGKAAHIEQPWGQGLDERRLSQRVRRLVISSRGRKPRSGPRLWFTADTLLYRAFTRPEDRHFRGVWLALTGLTPRSRVCVPLAGASLDDFAPRTDKPQSLPTLHVEISDRVVFHLRERVTPTAPIGRAEAGIDKGYATLPTFTRGAPDQALSYGARANVLIGHIAIEAAMRRKDRQRLDAYERSVRSSERRKARRIRRNNLGRVRQAKTNARDRARLTQAIGLALNELFRDNPDVAVLHVEDLHFRGSKFSRAMRLRFTKWLKGHLHRSLAYKAQLHGVRLNVVNAAWTSLTCPRCGCPSRRNRNGERFVCVACRYAGAADAVAATNILARGSDRAITRYMRKERVQQILMERWRSAPNGSAWSSNGGMDGLPPTSSEQLAATAVSPSFVSQNYPSPQ